MLVVKRNNGNISYSFKVAHVSKVVNKYCFLVESDVCDGSICDGVERGGGATNDEEVHGATENVSNKMVESTTEKASVKSDDVEKNANSGGGVEGVMNDTESKNINENKNVGMEEKKDEEDVKMSDQNNYEKDEGPDLKLKIEKLKKEKVSIEVNVGYKSTDGLYKMAGDQEGNHSEDAVTIKVDCKGDSDNQMNITNDEPTETTNENKPEEEDNKTIEDEKLKEKAKEINEESNSQKPTPKPANDISESGAKSNEKVVLCCHFTCMQIFPAGWAEQHGFKLDPVPGLYTTLLSFFFIIISFILFFHFCIVFIVPYYEYYIYTNLHTTTPL